MIGTILALALSASPQIDTEPFRLGRDVFFGGLCSTLGWKGDRDRAVGRGTALARSRPDLPANEFVAEMNRGMETGRAEALALLDEFQANGDAARFGQELTTRCDQVVRDEPEILSRTSDTNHVLETRIAAMRGDAGN